jgi:hypothetical protein
MVLVPSEMGFISSHKVIHGGHEGVWKPKGDIMWNILKPLYPNLSHHLCRVLPMFLLPNGPYCVRCRHIRGSWRVSVGLILQRIVTMMKSMAAERVSTAVMLQTRIQCLSLRILARKQAALFMVTAQSVQVESWIWGYDRFLLNPFHFIIHLTILYCTF